MLRTSLATAIFLLTATAAFAQSPPPGAPTGAARRAPPAQLAPSAPRSAPALAPNSPVIQTPPPQQLPPPPPPGKLPPPSIAVIDFGVILQNSIAAKNVRDPVERQSQTYQAEINKREQELRNTEQDLTRQRSVLSPEAFAEKRRQFEANVADFQRQTNSRKDQLQIAFDNGMREVQTNAAQILGEIKVERGVNLVFHANALALNDHNLDLTSEVLTRLDKKLPRVAVKLPPLK
jgi:outer membrane protein